MKVLVVDAAAEIRDQASLALRREGFEVITATDGAEGLVLAHAQPPALVVLDQMLPTMDGFEVARRICEELEIPVLMLTTRADESTTAVGPRAGIDDFLLKPFKPRDLVGRVKAVLRRAERARLKQTVLRLGNLELDREKREVRVQGDEVSLRAKEFALLLAFLQHPRVPLGRDRLLEQVWGYGFPGKTRTVDVHVNHLRGKLNGASVRIETLRGVGYKLVECATSADHAVGG